jgi:hypothetical protein
MYLSSVFSCHNNVPHLEKIFCGKGQQIFFVCAQIAGVSNRKNN